MRLARILCLAALVAMTGAVVHAGSIPVGKDPKIMVSKPSGGGNVTSAGHPFVCIGTCFSANSESDPLVISGLDITSFSFTYTGNRPLNTLWIEINPFSCGTCYVGDTTGPLSVFSMWLPDFGHLYPEFKFFGGSISKDQTFDVDVAPLVGTPEPSTLFLFLSMGPAVGFARKRWTMKRS